jgi:hypothetical protein
MECGSLLPLWTTMKAEASRRTPQRTPGRDIAGRWSPIRREGLTESLYR